MLRRLFTVLSALSLVLCVATIALWIDGRVVGKRSRLFGTAQDGLMLANKLDGSMLFVKGDMFATRLRPTRMVEVNWAPLFYYRSIGNPSRQYLLVVSHWFAFAVTAGCAGAISPTDASAEAGGPVPGVRVRPA